MFWLYMRQDSSSNIPINLRTKVKCCLLLFTQPVTIETFLAKFSEVTADAIIPSDYGFSDMISFFRAMPKEVIVYSNNLIKGVDSAITRHITNDIKNQKQPSKPMAPNLVKSSNYLTFLQALTPEKVAAYVDLILKKPLKPADITKLSQAIFQACLSAQNDNLPKTLARLVASLYKKIFDPEIKKSFVLRVICWCETIFETPFLKSHSFTVSKDGYCKFLIFLRELQIHGIVQRAVLLHCTYQFLSLPAPLSPTCAQVILLFLNLIQPILEAHHFEAIRSFLRGLNQKDLDENSSRQELEIMKRFMS